MVVREAGPACGAERFKRNGHIHTGKQNHQCKACGRQFVLDVAPHVIAEEQRTLVERLLREKISLHGMCRAVDVSLRWLMRFLGTCFAALPDHLHVQPVASPHDVLIGRLEVEAEEMWSFVKQQANKQWVWLAMDMQTRHIIPTVSPLLTPITSRNVLLLQSLPNSIPYRQDNVRRRKDDTCLGTATRSIVERLSRVP